MLCSGALSLRSYLVLPDGAVATAMRGYAHLSCSQQNQEGDTKWQTSLVAELSYIPS